MPKTLAGTIFFILLFVGVVYGMVRIAQSNEEKCARRKCRGLTLKPMIYNGSCMCLEEPLPGDD